jgi:tetratricopeptide (TPR) repeat protein
MRPVRRLPLLLTLVVLTGCAAPNPTASPLRLPTRAPVILTPTPLDARLYYEAGLAYQEAGDAEKALQFFTWAIRLAPGFAPAHLARGTVRLAQGRTYQALADADAALETDPTNANAYALRGEALRLQGRARSALEAFGQALELDPDLKAETFHSRWLAARATRDGDELLVLSKEYALAHPDDPLRQYYRGEAYVELEKTHVAVSIIGRAIEESADPPALLWFALGEAYAAEESWQEAVTSFETARALVQTGDTSLAIHTDRPVAELFGALGQAYLGAGRCVDAETMLKYAIDVGAPAAYAALLARARICQTPTPTITPYPTTTPFQP